MWTAYAIMILEEVEAGKEPAFSVLAQSAFRYLQARVKVSTAIKARVRKYIGGRITYHWDMSKCEHLTTRSRAYQTGSFCDECGAKVLEEETRPCGDCKHIKEISGSHICVKNLMGVVPTMHVMYKVTLGTCFESKL